MKRFLPAMLVLLLCFSLAACGSDSGSAQSDTAYPENETTALSLEESITKSNPNTVKDVGSFEGFWMSEETDQYDFIVFDEDGNWSLCKGVDEIDKGYLYYDNETDATCLHSDMGGAADGGCIELEGSRLYITTLGYFKDGV